MAEEQGNNEIVEQDDLAKQEKQLAEYKRTLEERFAPFRETAKEWLDKAKGYKITSVEQAEEIAESRKARLALVKVRTGVDKLKKQLNAPDQERIKLTNAIAKELTDLVTPIEAVLQANEDFIDTETLRLSEEKKNARIERLNQFGTNTQFFDLGTMDDAVFEELYKDQELLFNAKKAEREKQEAADKLAAVVAKHKKELEAIADVKYVDGHWCEIDEIGLRFSDGILGFQSETWDLWFNETKAKIDNVREEARKAEEEKNRKLHELSMRFLNIQRLGFYPSEEDLKRNDGAVERYVHKKYDLEIGGSALELDAQEWVDLIKIKAETIKGLVAEDDRKAKEETDRLLKIRDGIISERISALGGIGYKRNGATDQILHPEGFGPRLSVNVVADMTSDQFIESIKSLTTTTANAAKKAREEAEAKAAADKAEKEANASDKQKIAAFLEKLSTLLAELKQTEFKSNKNLNFFRVIAEGLNDAVNSIKRSYKI